MIQSTDILRELSVAEKLSRVARLWKMVADRELEPLNLTYPRWTALWKLHRMGDHVSQKQLAEALEIELASLMRTLKLLEEQSLVTRHCCESDKRARIVSLTQEGQALITQLESRILEVRKKLLSEINDEDLKTMGLVLEQMASNALGTLSK
ncbi:helix_turn_helix multiple antibiotic resistance protein [Vibrio sp. B1FLJ16]|uniref:MarR family transcriptional regulator n=1 Tax=Vibrio sp. B1FLJ16 TaxID=2751178 RepID=UPI0015F5B7BD|nr:MarR family transcriptional regulator [Vibrio sp. B1FLJ16]CAD7818493.1 helix_turn_helix multiple antibiotic resistance protein [Vibrio sp. B1FLJ16]CAE6934873.1 helix_turn_helix multiple antibiotic resistance protein [Vibrio sp. B1FLJ16]